jgi:hypothetical protein
VLPFCVVGQEAVLLAILGQRLVSEFNWHRIVDFQQNGKIEKPL